MFGNTKEIRKETENNKKNEPCFGGCGGRLSYELFSSKNRRAKLARIAPRIATVFVSCVLLGTLGTLCGVMMFNVIQNRQTPYPTDFTFSANSKNTESASSADSTGTVSKLSSTYHSTLLENVTKDHSERYRVPLGILVREIPKDTIAYNTGIRPGDIIVAVNGNRVKDISEFEKHIDLKKSDDHITIRLFRDGEYYDFVVPNK